MRRASKCCLCGKAGDLRPYGPKGAPICYPCMKSSPIREAEAKKEFDRLKGEHLESGRVTLLTDDGPVPGPRIEDLTDEDDL